MAQEVLLASLQWLQTSAEYSDLRIACGDQTFPVHKAVVCPRSSFLATACRWNQEGKVKDEVDLGDDDDPSLIGLMIDFLYRLDYNDENVLSKKVTITRSHSIKTPQKRNRITRQSSLSSLSSEDSDSPEPIAGLRIHKLVVNATMYALGDKYGIDGLKSLARTKFAETKFSNSEIKDFVHAAQLAFATTPSSDLELRSAVANKIVTRSDLLRFLPIRDLLASTDGLAWLVLNGLWHAHSIRPKPSHDFK